MPISRLSATSCVGLEPRPLPSAGVTRFRRYYGPLRHPRRSSLSLAGVWLKGSTPRRSGFPCCVDLRVPTCRRHYPGGPLGSDRSWDGLFHPFPVPQRRRPSPSECKVGATLVVSRPARRSRVLRPVGSPSRHATRLSRRLRRFCRLHRRSDSYRLERPSCRVGIAPTEDQHLSTARNRSDPAASPPRPTPAERNRSATIEKVQTIWITGVLKRSLYSQVNISLGLSERPDAVTRPIDL